MNKDLLRIYLDELRTACRSIRIDVNNIEDLVGLIESMFIEEENEDEN
jgi:hypothetical protein